VAQILTMLRTNQVCNLKHGNSLLKIRLVLNEIEIHHKNSLKKMIGHVIYNITITFKTSGLQFTTWK
jgi:hypothetical protein